MVPGVSSGENYCGSDYDDDDSATEHPQASKVDAEEGLRDAHAHAQTSEIKEGLPDQWILKKVSPVLESIPI